MATTRTLPRDLQKALDIYSTVSAVTGPVGLITLGVGKLVGTQLTRYLKDQAYRKVEKATRTASANLNALEKYIRQQVLAVALEYRGLTGAAQRARETPFPAPFLLTKRRQPIEFSRETGQLQVEPGALERAGQASTPEGLAELIETGAQSMIAGGFGLPVGDPTPGKTMGRIDALERRKIFGGPA